MLSSGNDRNGRDIYEKWKIWRAYKNEILKKWQLNFCNYFEINFTLFERKISKYTLGFGFH